MVLNRNSILGQITDSSIGQFVAKAAAMMNVQSGGIANIKGALTNALGMLITESGGAGGASGALSSLSSAASSLSSAVSSIQDAVSTVQDAMSSVEDAMSSFGGGGGGGTAQQQQTQNKASAASLISATSSLNNAVAQVAGSLQKVNDESGVYQVLSTVGSLNSIIISTAATTTITISGATPSGKILQILINGQTASYTTVANDTDHTCAVALAAAVNTMVSEYAIYGVSASVSSASVIIEAPFGTTIYAATNSSINITVAATSSTIVTIGMISVGQALSITIAGHTVNYTVVTGDTSTSVAAAFASEINNLHQTGISATSNDAVITLTLPYGSVVTCSGSNSSSLNDLSNISSMAGYSSLQQIQTLLGQLMSAASAISVLSTVQNSNNVNQAIADINSLVTANGDIVTSLSTNVDSVVSMSNQVKSDATSLINAFTALQ